MDGSNGYEGIAPEFLARRGSGRSTGIGVNQVRKWARTLLRGAAVIDLGCGPGFPITEVLVAESLSTFGVDPAPSFIQALQTQSPEHTRRLRSRPGFEILRSHFRWCPGVGTHVPAFARGPATSSRGSRGYWCQGEDAVYVSCGTNCLERCDDGSGITLPGSRGVPSAHVSSWSLDRQ